MSEQLFLEAFNSEPYFFEKEEKYGAMDIIYTFEDEAGHGFKFHFEKKVALGKHAYVCVLSQKTPGLKTYKRVIGKFSNPMRTVATLLAVVRDIHDTRKDVHGIVMSIPEQAFGSYSRLVKKIMTRELRTVLNVEDGEYTPEDFEKMGLVGIVTTVKPRNMNTVYTGPALKEYQERQAGKDGAGVSAPAVVVPDVKAPSVVQTMPSQTKEITTIVFEVTRYSKDESTAFNASVFARNTTEGGVVLQQMRDEIKKIAGKNGQLPATLSKLTYIEKGVLKARFDSDFLSEVVEMLKKFENSTIKLSGIEKLEDLIPKRTPVAQTMPVEDLVPKQPVVDPVAEKENFYFDYDHRQITLTFNDKETAGRIKDQLLELGAATFNGNEFFTDKEKLILVDDKSLDVKKVQETLFPILGQPLMLNGVFVDPNIRSSVRSPDGVIYRIKGNTIQVEDAPKDSAMTIVRELIPMADRIFDDKGSNTLELNEQGIADGFTMHNIAPVFKKSNISKRLSARLFRSWESAVTEASNKYDLSTGDLGSSFTNNSSYLIDAATSGVVGEYLRTDGNVISGIVLNTNYMIREAVAKPLVALGFTVEYDVKGWRTQVKLPVNSDYTIPGTSELAVFIKEVDNLANIARRRRIVEYVGGNKNFEARWNPDDSRAFLVLPTAESSGLGWRDYTAYATAPQYVRVDNIETYEEFLKLTDFVKNFDFGANLLRNIGVSKYLSDVRSGGATASKSYKLKDGGEVEISFKFGDKVTFIFNQNSEGFDKEMSEFVSEKMEISGRASAIPLYMLGTADANKTLKNIDAWLDAHIVSKEDNSSKGNAESTEALIDQEIESKKSWAEDVLRESLSHNTSGQTVAKVEYVGTSRPTKNHVLYIFKLLVQPKFGTPVAQKAFVKGTIGLDVVTGYSGTGQNRQPMIKPVSITLDRSVTSWVGYDYDPKVADQYEKDMTFDVKSDAEASKVSVPTTAPKSKNIVKPLISAIESVSKDGKEKKVTGFDLRVGETWAYDGHRGEMNNLLFISGPESTSLDSKIRSLGGAVLLRGVTRVGDLTIEFEDVAKKRKSKLTFTCGGLVQGSFESLKGSFSPATKSKVDKLISKMFTDSPQAIANEFADFIGNPDLRYKIVKDARKPAILISKNPAGFKEALADAELLLESQLDEGIKEDLTGKAPNRVKRELLEATLQKLGLYRESFTYGNATFKTVMSECAVEIIPTSGNIRNFAKMLGARLGQELRIDDEGFLSFDLDNI